MSIVSREAEQLPELLRPRPGCHHDLLADRDEPVARLDGGDAAVGCRPKIGHLGVRKDLDALGEALVAKPEHGLHVEREPALVLVQAGRDALRAPVREERFHVAFDVVLAGDQLGAVADPLVALMDGGEVGFLGLRAERDVADAVVVVRGGVRLPDLHAGLHQLAHRRLEVVVADDPAGDPRCPRAGNLLLDHGDVRARAEAPPS